MESKFGFQISVDARGGQGAIECVPAEKAYTLYPYAIFEATSDLDSAYFLT